jgi:hypothetical protein
MRSIQARFTTLFDFRLTRGEASDAIFRVQDESAEVAKTVEGKRVSAFCSHGAPRR